MFFFLRFRWVYSFQRFFLSLLILFAFSLIRIFFFLLIFFEWEICDRFLWLVNFQEKWKLNVIFLQYNQNRNDNRFMTFCIYLITTKTSISPRNRAKVQKTREKVQKCIRVEDKTTFQKRFWKMVSFWMTAWGLISKIVNW